MADTQEKEYYLDLGRKFKTLRKRVGKTTEEVAEEAVKAAFIFHRAQKKTRSYYQRRVFARDAVTK